MEEVAQKREINVQKIKEILNSKWLIFVLAFIIVFFWAIDFPYVSLPILLVHEGLVLYFCREDIKAFLFPVVAISYSITSIHATGLGNWIFYLSIFGLFIIFLILYIIREKVKYKRKFKKGKLFPAFVLAGIGNMLGGIIGFFDIKIFLIVTLFCVFVCFLYWFFINFLSNDDKKYVAYVLIGVTAVICAEILIAYIRFGDFFLAVSYKAIRVGSGEINAAAIFMMSGVCSCFYLARGNKFDYLYLLLAVLFDCFVYLTYSRIALAICALATLVYFIVVFKDSPNKKLILIALAIILSIVGVLVGIFWDKMVDFFGFYLKMGFNKNGREYLWKWCFYQFEDNILFGIGFVTREEEVIRGVIPGLQNLGIGIEIVYAHNTMLHFLTCTGLVGTILNLFLYYKKYQMVFTKFNKFKFYALMNYICIFIAGCFDPTPNKSIFHIAVSILFMALVELDNEKQEPWEIYFGQRKQAKFVIKKYKRTYAKN